MLGAQIGSRVVHGPASSSSHRRTTQRVAASLGGSTLLIHATKVEMLRGFQRYSRHNNCLDRRKQSLFRGAEHGTSKMSRSPDQKITYDGAIVVVAAESPISTPTTFRASSGAMDFLLTARMSVSLLSWIIKRLTTAGPLPEPARDDVRRYQAERSDGCAPERQALQTFR